MSVGETSLPASSKIRVGCIDWQRGKTMVLGLRWAVAQHFM